MKHTWSITESLYVYYSYDGNRVFLANPESKKFYGTVKKIAESVKDPEVIKNDGHPIKFCDEKIKINLSGIWYVIGNVYKEDIVSQLSSVTINSGEVSDVMFGFNPVYPDQALPLFPGSELYKESEREFVRKTNLSLYTKTTKYKPGHKYECDNGTYIYLGEVVSHKSDRLTSKRFTTATGGVRKLGAFINDIPENPRYEDIITEYTIKEFANYPEDLQEKTIFLINKNKAMADIGEIIQVSGVFEDMWETKIKNYVTKGKQEYSYESSLYHYKDLDDLIRVFSVSTNLIPKVTDEAKELMKKIVETEYRYYLYRFYDIQAQANDLNILSKNSNENQRDALVNNLIENGIRDTQNFYDKDYYKEMFKTLFDINLQEVAETSLESFKLLTVSVSDYQDLIDNFSYLEYREPEKYTKKVDFVYTNEDKRSFDKFFKKGMYQDVIKDIYTKALQDNGSELKKFSVSNIGTAKSPELQYVFSVTLEDIKNYFGVNSIFDIPETFKKELVKNKIYRVNFKTRDNIKVKM